MFKNFLKNTQSINDETIRRKTEIIRESFFDHLSSSSLSFLLKAFKPKNRFLRMLWTVFILASLTTCHYYLVLIILDYFKYTTITSIDQVYESQMEFPTISFCSANTNDTNFNEISILKLNFNYNQLLNQSFQLNDYFEVFKDSIYNQCYRFNSGKTIMRSTYPGFLYGFNIDFYFQTNNPDFGQLALFIHNHSMPPPTLFGFADIISAGCSYFYEIDKTLNVKLPQPYNDCLKDVSQFSFNKTIINNILQHKNRQYSQDYCLYMCENLIFNEQNNCGCTYVDLQDFLPVCISNSEASDQCINLFFQDLFLKNQKELCADYCPLECDSFNLHLTQKVQPIITANNQLSSHFIYPQFNTYANFSHNFYSINVFYNNLKYTYISQSAKFDTFSLISNIGGLFSLFLGLSFVSLIDVFHIVFVHLYLAFKRQI